MASQKRWFEDGRIHPALGIEDTFVPQARPGERPIDEYELTEHYARYADDFALAAASGAEFLRWGVPWYRIQPEPGRWDWSWTDRAVDALLAAGLRPIVDLMHYGTPLWLDEQLAGADYPERVAEFGGAFAARFGDRVTDFTPVNEPVVHALFGGEYGYWPPYRSGVVGFHRVAVQIARGLVRTQQAIGAELGADATFVHVDAAMFFVGDDDAPEHRDEATRLRRQVHLVEDLVTGGVDAAHPLAESVVETAGEEALAWFQENAVRPDVMGVNYYPRISTERFEPGVRHVGGFADPRPAVDRGGDGLREALEGYHARYGAPVMVTETCVTGTVDERLAWLDESTALLEVLRDEGLPVVGYTWWPLFDMYEWTWRHTQAHRADHLLTMGLADLVESDSGLLRVPNPVFHRYRHLADRFTTSHTKD